MEKDAKTQEAVLQKHFATLAKNEWLTTGFGATPPPFVKGLELSERFFHEQVEPIIRACMPELSMAAGRIDYGSDVLGYDTELSRDHAWGPQVTIFLSDKDFRAHSTILDEQLQRKLPIACAGYPTRMTRDPIWHTTPDGSGHHRVRFESLRSFFENEIGFLPSSSMSYLDWLCIPAQKLRVYASGKVFADDTGELTALREGLRWYPRDIWLHITACQWEKLRERAPFAGRCAHVGDTWGAAHNAHETILGLVQIAHLLEQRYPPYKKWLGSSLNELSIGSQLIEIAERVRLATSWPQMEDAVIEAYQLVAHHHNSIEGLPRISPEVITFFSRPYRMIDIEAVVKSLKDAVADTAMRELPLAQCALWQFSEYDPALCNPQVFRLFRGMLVSADKFVSCI